MVRVDNENFRLQKGIAALAVLLLFVKLVAYFMTNSTAILTDVMETTVNVVAAFIGLSALYLSAQPADHSHPFGHGKVELISALIEGSMITIAGILMIYESVDSLFNPREISDLGIGILLIIAAGVANYVVGMAAIRRGKRNMSPALVASGRHLMSDTYVAVGIILGLTAVFLAMNAGYDARWLDSTIALVFSLFIVATGIKVIKESMDDLMDKADEALLSSLSESLKSHRHSDWVDLFGLRIMKHGNIVYADFRIILPRDMTVEDVARETDELQAAITGTIGPDVEIAVTPIPCESRHCIHCDKECGMRASEFVGQIEWDMGTMTSDAPQSSERRWSAHHHFIVVMPSRSMGPEIPQQIASVRLDDWYVSLSDPDRVRLRRYLDSDPSSKEAFLSEVMRRSSEDHNYNLSVTAGKFAVDLPLDDFRLFMVREGLIDGLANAGAYAEAKDQCRMNLELLPAIRDELLAANGGELPKGLMCRNRLIDIMVGIESDYDGALALLDEFAASGVMDPEELGYRKQSLKIHRMQKSFDSLFTYRPKERIPSRGASGLCRCRVPRKDGCS